MSLPRSRLISERPVPADAETQPQALKRGVLPNLAARVNSCPSLCRGGRTLLQTCLRIERSFWESCGAQKARPGKTPKAKIGKSTTSVVPPMAKHQTASAAADGFFRAQREI